MNKFIVLTILSAILLTSCLKDEKRSDDALNEVPQAFQDESILSDVSFKRGYENVTEKIYEELLEKDESLKALEERIIQLEKDMHNDNLELNDFFSNNNQYYTDIKTKTETVKDTVLRDLLIQKIDESEHNYSEKMKEIKTLKEILNYQIDVLREYRTAMKIILTEQRMKEYQNNFKQDTSMLHSLIQRYEETTKEIQSKIEE